MVPSEKADLGLLRACSLGREIISAQLIVRLRVPRVPPTSEAVSIPSCTMRQSQVSLIFESGLCYASTAGQKSVRGPCVYPTASHLASNEIRVGRSPHEFTPGCTSGNVCGYSVTPPVGAVVVFQATLASAGDQRNRLPRKVGTLFSGRERHR